MYVTTYSNKDNGDQHVFIRLNETVQGAWTDAMADAEETMSEYETQNGTQVIKKQFNHMDDNPYIISIVNPNNGYEYEAYIIEEHIVND